MARQQRAPTGRSVEDPLSLLPRRPTRLQRRALEVLEDAHARLAKCPAWNKKLPRDEVENLWKDGRYDMAMSEWSRAVLRAARAGVLVNKDLVESSLAAQFARSRIVDWRAQGQRDFLARARTGLERGVKPPFTLEEVRVSDAIWEKMEDREYPTLEAVRRALIRQGAIPKMTKQSFLRLVERLELRAK